MLSFNVEYDVAKVSLADIQCIGQRIPTPIDRTLCTEIFVGTIFRGLAPKTGK